MRSTKQLVDELRTTDWPLVDTAIVVAFEGRFEFVAEDHPAPVSRLENLVEQGGLAIGLAGVKPGAPMGSALQTRVFTEYAGQAWAHRYMTKLREIVRCHSVSD